MMKNKKSGWPGKVKVTMAIVCTVIFSVIIVQCNSKFEEPVSIGSEKLASNEFTEEINLPVLPERKDPVVLDLTDALDFSISGNKLTINGEPFEIDEIREFFEKKNFSKPVTIVLRADKDQKMDFIRKVQMELRKAEQRKILYLGKTMYGAKVETTLLLPPTPENAAKLGIPQQPDVLELEADGKLEILKIDMGDNAGALNQQKVYDFVKNHMQKQSTDYVVSARFKNDDTFNDYLVSLVSIKDGFNKIYQERAQEMFGKDFYDADKEEFQKVRQGIPMAISIAE